MFFVKNLEKNIKLIGNRNYWQVTKCANITHSINPRLNRYIGNAVFKERQISNFQKYNRFMSTLNSNHRHVETAIWSDTKRDFMATLPTFIKDMTENVKRSDEDVSQWLEKVLQYNLSGGKKFRSLFTILFYKLLEKPENLNSENLHLANIMGWCVEMFHTFFLVYDDIMDKAEMRRGILCWYRQPDVGLIAINDGLLLQSCIFSLLKKYFRDKPYYTYMLEIFNEMLLKSTIGQCLDMTSSKGDKPDLSKFTMDRYNAIVKYKTAYNTFEFPVNLAIMMCGFNDPEVHSQLKTIFFQMGQLFQIQDDFHDCYGNLDVTGTDIQQGKCTWLSVVALQRVNPAQKLIMEEYYGSADHEHVTKIKTLYDELAIPKVYEIYKSTSYNLITNQIQQIPTRYLPHELFYIILEKLYHRNA